MNKGKLESLLPQLYSEMHDKHMFKGDSWTSWYADLLLFLGGAAGIKAHTILDYGCGPLGGLNAETSMIRKQAAEVVAYDPYVIGYQTTPWDKRLTAVFSCDVLEHMPLSAILTLCTAIKNKATITHAMFVIATRAANKTMSNGLNAHITVHTAEWWYGFMAGTFSSLFDIRMATANMIDGTVMITLTRRLLSDAHYLAA